MPKYDYRCEKENRVFEIEQSMLDPVLTKCPSCGGAVQRLISKGISTQFTGSGFYVTDKRTDKNTTSSTSSSSSTSEGAKGSESPSGDAKNASGTSSKDSKKGSVTKDNA
ncbi:MAG: zinc ribbon domain-containing protein [bacterium]